MKIIDTDNFDGDYPNEKIVAYGITDEKKAQIMCKALNDEGPMYASRYYMVVDDDYALKPGFEP